MLTAEYRLVLYAIALVIGLAVFTRVRSRVVRQGVLLVGSYVLYATWGLWFAAVLLASTLMNFLFGKALRRQQSAGILWIGIICNLLLLGSFKYLPGFADSLPFASLQRFAHIALPLGISFWTFQAMSYLFDLYRGEELDPTLWEFALYMVFFPVAISGPICRMPDMLPQFRSEEPVQRSDMARGLCRIATGALMIQLGQLLGRGILNAGGINAGFDQVKQWSGPDVWCLAFGYGLQLFFDFGGYSHIAIGAARMLGFTVPENFARPFASTTPSIFWTRWHMSLSFWIRDYVFLPLATLRREMLWRNLALVVSMVLFGLWHKASLLFVLSTNVDAMFFFAARLAEYVLLERHKALSAARLAAQITHSGAQATQRPTTKLRSHIGYLRASSAGGGSGASWAQRIAGGVTAPPLPACRADGRWPERGKPRRPVLARLAAGAASWGFNSGSWGFNLVARLIWDGSRRGPGRGREPRQREDVALPAR